MLSKLCKLDCLSFLDKLFALLTWVQSCPLIEKFLYLCTRQYLSSRGSYVNKRDFSDGLLVHEPKSKPGSCWYVNRSPSFNDVARFFLHFFCSNQGQNLKVIFGTPVHFSAEQFLLTCFCRFLHKVRPNYLLQSVFQQF